MMIILLGTRTIYYLVFRFSDLKYESGRQINNKELIFIYFEEILFNVVVFYQMALKDT